MANTHREQPASAEKYGELFSVGPPYRLQAVLGLIGPEDLRIKRRALIAALVAWLPLAVLTAIRGDFAHESGGQSLLSDFGVHARFLVAIPMLILADAMCGPRLGSTARHFIDARLVASADRARFDAAVASTRKLRDSTLVEIAVVILAYALVSALSYSVLESDVQGWHRSDPGRGLNPSPAGWWGLLVSLPILLILILGWAWRWILWTRLLWLVSRLDLRLIPSHPDRAAGLRFVSYTVRAWWPLGFTLGAIVAGVLATKIVHHEAVLFDYRYGITAVALTPVALFTAPLLVFFGKLLEAWRRGLFEYGELVDRFGRHFERKWLQQQAHTDDSILERPDFSAATDLYQVADRVHEMRLVPVDFRSLVMLAVATLLPFAPVVLLGLPFDDIVSALAGLLF